MKVAIIVGAVSLIVGFLLGTNYTNRVSTSGNTAATQQPTEADSAREEKPEQGLIRAPKPRPLAGAKRDLTPAEVQEILEVHLAGLPEEVTDGMTEPPAEDVAMLNEFENARLAEKEGALQTKEAQTKPTIESN